MVIIQKSPYVINRWYAEIEKLMTHEKAETIQMFIQSSYSETCFSFEKSLPVRNGKRHFFFKSINQDLPAHIIQSMDKRQFVLYDNLDITLSLYQVISNDRKHGEDILVEPFYPGCKLTLMGIYDSIKGNPVKSTSRLYRLQRDTRIRFTKKLETYGMADKCQVSSFDDFHEFIHCLSDDILHELFGSWITFSR